MTVYSEGGPKSVMTLRLNLPSPDTKWPTKVYLMIDEALFCFGEKEVMNFHALVLLRAIADLTGVMPIKGGLKVYRAPMARYSGLESVVECEVDRIKIPRIYRPDEPVTGSAWQYATIGYKEDLN